MEPIFFVPFFEETSRGGNRLADYYGKYSRDLKVSDSWELSSVQYRQSIVRTAEFAGSTLSELYSRNRELFGTKSDYFPITIKLLDVDILSYISVHGGGAKDDGYQYEGWYVIVAEDGAELMMGTSLKNKDQFYSAIKENSVMATAYMHESKQGECFLIPPGVPHSIGAGNLIYEISSPLKESPQIYELEKQDKYSMTDLVDTILYMEEIEPVEPKRKTENIELLLEADFFTLEKINAEPEVSLRLEDTFFALTALGRGVVSGREFSYRYNAGETFLVPAGDEEIILSGSELLKATPVEEI